MKFFACLLVVNSVCLIGTLAESECEEQQKKALQSDSDVKLIPKCTSDGKFKALQCFQGSSECTCYRPEGGQIIEPRSKLKTCDCITHKDKVKSFTLSGKKLVGSYMPQCEEDGSYSKTQCRGSTGACWCVDEAGKTVSKRLDKC